MSVLAEYFTLANGVKIPKLGLGTWQISNEDVLQVVAIALKNKYRLIDSAAAYQNEEGVGQAVRESEIAREEIFITTKIPAEIKTYEKAKQQIEASLEKLNLDYIDLLLIHAPKPWAVMGKSEKTYFKENIEVYKAMEEAYIAGKIKSIGVANFMKEDLENIIAHNNLVPMVNQIRYHIGYLQAELVAFCKEKEILVQGYSPLATGRLLKNVALKEVSGKYKKSVAQLCIQFVLQNEVLPLPKSIHKDRITQNSQLDFEISAVDMVYLKGILEK